MLVCIGITGAFISTLASGLAESENVFDFRKGGKNNIKAQIGKG
jgi:hypothetical protein